jgi:hypothetical protein
MKRSSVPLLLFCLTIFSFSKVFSQGIHLGLTTSMNATYVLDQGLSKDPRYNATATYKWAPVGFNFGVDIGRKFGLSLESIMARQGQVYEIIDAAEKVKGERKIDIKTLQIPMLLRFMSGGNAGVRGNFNFGPQLNLLTDAVESVQAQAGTYDIPEGVDFASIKAEFPGAVESADGKTYNLPSNVPTREILSKKANDFKSTEFAVALAFGLDIDLSKHLYLTTQVRGNYTLTDMRNGDVIEQIKSGSGGSIFGQRANLNVGMQLGLHYTLGKTRSFKFKE